ncbi:MAG: hypothetical protein ACP5KI_06815, partial [Brevinematia bacterium]
WWFGLLGDNVIWNWNKIESVFREHYWELGFYVRNDGLRLFFFIQNNSVREPAIEPFDQGMINVFHFGLRAIDEKFSF